MALTGEADTSCDLGDRLITANQQFLRAIDSALDDVSMRRNTCAGFERLSEMMGTQASDESEAREAQILFEMVLDVLSHLAKLCGSEAARNTGTLCWGRTIRMEEMDQKRGCEPLGVKSAGSTCLGNFVVAQCRNSLDGRINRSNNHRQQFGVPLERLDKGLRDE